MKKSQSGCRDMEPLLCEAVDGRIEDADRARLDAHLAACAACREEMDLALAASRDLRSLPGEELPPFFRSRLLARLDDPDRIVQSAHRLPLRSLRFAWGTSAALAVALVGTFLWFQAARVGLRPSKPSALLLSQAQTSEAKTVDEARIAALRAGIQPVSPLDDSVVSASDVAICAALSPAVSAARFRLLVDGRDVTALADITRDYIIFDPEKSLGDGPHMVTVEIDTGQDHIERSWIFYAMDGSGRKELRESPKPGASLQPGARTSGGKLS